MEIKQHQKSQRILLIKCFDPFILKAPHTSHTCARQRHLWLIDSPLPVSQEGTYQTFGFM